MDKEFWNMVSEKSKTDSKFRRMMMKMIREERNNNPVNSQAYKIMTRLLKQMQELEDNDPKNPLSPKFIKGQRRLDGFFNGEQN